MLQPNSDRPEDAEIAVSPTSRAGAVYLLDTGRTAMPPPTSEYVSGCARWTAVDLVAWLAGVGRRPACTRRGRAPRRRRGARPWSSETASSFASAPAASCATSAAPSGMVEGEPEALAADITRGRFEADQYPDGLSRLWSALTSPHAGDVLISAADGYECVDWGGVSHTGGGSHGALGRGDSLGAAAVRRLRAEEPAEHPQWALRDLAPVILEHFGDSG